MMNADRNGKQDAGRDDQADLTAFALGQLEETAASKIQSRLNEDAGAQVVVEESRRLAGLLQQVGQTDLPAEIDGLENRIAEALDQGAVQEVGLSEKSGKTAFWSGRRMLAVAATVLLAAGGSWFLLRGPWPRQVAEHDSTAVAPAGDRDESRAGEFAETEPVRSAEQMAGRGPAGQQIPTGRGDGEATLATGLEAGRAYADRNQSPLVTANGPEKSASGTPPVITESLESITDEVSGLQAELTKGKQVAQRESSRGRGGQTQGQQVIDGKDVFRIEPNPQGSDSAVRELDWPDNQARFRQDRDAQSSLPSQDLTEAKRPAWESSQPLPSLTPSSLNRAIAVPDGGEVSLGGIKLGGIQPGGIRPGGPPASEPMDRLAVLERASDGAGEADETADFFTARGSWINRPGWVYRDADRARPANEQYELPPENPFLRPLGEQARSTFAVDVDTASYANIRRFVTGGQLPPPAAVRVEEMVNYFDYDYAPPTDGKPFSVNLEVAGCPWNPSNKLVRIGVQGKEIARDDRPASNLVFLIDVSGSMSDNNKLPLLQRSMLMLVDHLTENDRVTVVTYAGNAGLRMPPTSGDQKQKIRGVISGLASGGSTHGSAGIQMAYDLASENFIEEGTNRVILATDGDLNVGVTADDQLVTLIRDRARSGIFLSVLGFGTGNLKDAKLEKLADNGNGQYSYIDSIREARKVLVEEITGLIAIAKDVKIQVEFNPAEVAGYRLIGYENRALQNEDFANDAVDAGEIGAGHTVTAIYELVPAGVAIQSGPRSPVREPLRYQQSAKTGRVPEKPKSESGFQLTDAAKSGELLSVALRYKEPQGQHSTRLDFTIQDNARSFDEASRDFRFAAAVASYGMFLRQSPHAGSWNLGTVEETAAATIGEDARGHRSEFVDLVRQTAAMFGR